MLQATQARTCSRVSMFPIGLKSNFWVFLSKMCRILSEFRPQSGKVKTVQKSGNLVSLHSEFEIRNMVPRNCVKPKILAICPKMDQIRYQTRIVSKFHVPRGPRKVPNIGPCLNIVGYLSLYSRPENSSTLIIL